MCVDVGRQSQGPAAFFCLGRPMIIHLPIHYARAQIPLNTTQEAVHAAQALQQAAEQANNDILAEQERVKAQADPSRWVCCVVRGGSCVGFGVCVESL